MTKYSFVIPVYQTSDYLSKCIDSLLLQTYKDYEIVLVDDGSTDGSSDICDSYSKRDSRIKVFHKDNEGQGVARNLGVLYAQGEYIIFVDSDDWWDDENALGYIDELSKGCDVISFGLKTVGNVEDKLKVFEKLQYEYNNGRDFIMDVLTYNPSFPWYPVLYAFKKKIWIDNHIEYPSKTYFEDTATIYKIFLYSEKVSVLPKYFYCYRQLRNTSTTKNVSLRLLNNHIDVCNSCISYINNIKRIDPILKERLLNNFGCGYVDVMNFLSLLSKNDYHIMKKKMKENIHITKYIKYGKQKYMAVFVNMFGIDISSKVFRLIQNIKNK